MKYIKQLTKILLFIIAVQLPLCASDVETSIANDMSTIAGNIAELVGMSAQGLLWCGQKAIGITRTLTTFMKDHPVIATTVGLSAYAAWRVLKYKYSNRIYHMVGNAQPQAYYYCPSCDRVIDPSFLLVH